MPEPKKPSRRRFIFGGLGVAGALVVGWGILPPRQRLNASQPLPVHDGEIAMNGWITIASDGMVSVVMHRSEMGQGIHTALQMLVAEELDVPMKMVKPIYAPADKIYGNLAVLADGLPFHPDDTGSLKRVMRWMTLKLARELAIQMTGGSSSVKDAWQPMREAGATARSMLVAAAAKKWSVAPGECKTLDGVVTHVVSGKSATYGELAAAAVLAQPTEVRLKRPDEFKIIGTAQPRTDASAKSDGSAQFGIDARPDGMLYAALKQSPVTGGKLKQFDASKVLGMPGVVQVMDISMPDAVSAVAVIAKSYWQARQALAALPATWDDGAYAALSTENIFKEFANKLDTDSGHAYHEVGDVQGILSGGTIVKKIQAEYRAPFLAHAAMEPVNCTAQVRDGKVDIWVSTQVPGICTDLAAKVAKVKSENINLHMAFLGGGFGRRLEADMVVQAVRIAMETKGAPVKLIWSREEDITHDMYRPAALARFTAGLDATGKLVAYDNKSASGSIAHQFLKRTFGIAGAGPDKTTAEGEFDMPYEIQHQRIAHVIVPSPVAIGFWRSVGHSHNAFFKESFIDEIAHAAKQDGLSFRRQLLSNHPRHLAVLDALAKEIEKPAEGRAQGLALHESFGTIVAQMAEVSVLDGQIRVHKVICSVDCGIAVNPNIIAQQMESAVVFGLSAALYGEISIKDGKVIQSNFNDYQVLRCHEAPEVETIIVRSAEPPQGIGEPGVPPVAPAVANAVFALTGQRLRSLPLKLS